MANGIPRSEPPLPQTVADSRKPSGAVATMEAREFTRVKNIYIVPQCRRRGIAAATLREIANRLCGEFGLGAFGIEGNAGAER